jgi:CHAD domain-containing protein
MTPHPHWSRSLPTRTLLLPAQVCARIDARLDEASLAARAAVDLLATRTDPDAVHEARAALRRWRLAHALVGSHRPTSPSLEDLDRVLARLRDLDVAAGIIQPTRSAREERAALAEDLPARVAPALADLAPVPVPARRLEIGPLVRSWERSLTAAAHDPSWEHLHAARRAGRRVRFAAELVRPAAPLCSTALAREAGRFASYIGHAHDLVIAAALLDPADPVAAELRARSQRAVRAWRRRARDVDAALRAFALATAARSAHP